MEVSAHELTRTALCKEPGCPEEAIAKVGRYALLCQAHTAEKRRERAANQPPAPRLRAVGPMLEPKARELVKLAREVDRAQAVVERVRAPLRAAEGLLEAAQAAWGDALDELRGLP